MTDGTAGDATGTITLGGTVSASNITLVGDSGIVLSGDITSNNTVSADTVLLLVISPERTMPLSPTRVIFEALTVPPKVIVPVASPAVPSVNEIISSSPVLVIFPAIVISPPPLFIENVPST